MKRRSALTALTLLVVCISPCLGNSWQLLYETNFSTDPGWVTSRPSHYYWDSDETFFIHQENISFGGNYAVIETDHDGGSFFLQYDICMLSTQYASGISFGIYDPDLNSNNYGSYVQIHFVQEDRGYVIFLEAKDQYENHFGDVSTSPQFEFDIWYRVSVEYNAEDGTIMANIEERETGNSIAMLSVSGVDSFASDMNLLGNSNIRAGTFQVNGAECTAKIDNILLMSFMDSIPAVVNIFPETLNLKSKGKWITAFIALPEQVDVSQVNPQSLTLEGIIPADWCDIDESEQFIKAKFSRQALIDLLTEAQLLSPGEVELIVSGELTDGSYFEASDTICIIH